MKKGIVALASFVYLIAAYGMVALCEESNQAASKVSDGVLLLKNSGSGMIQKNYQDEVLSNPETSGAARAESANAGGNTAIINQSGSSNSSSVIQMGDNNKAEQTQKGKHNHLRIEQTGRNNRSSENQTGNYNRKVIIQNGSETIIEQVTPEK